MASSAASMEWAYWGQESRVEAAEGVQLPCRRSSRREGYCSLTARMVACSLEGEWAKSRKTVVCPFLGYFLEPFGGTVVSGDAAEEVGVGDAQFPAGEVGGGDVLEVVLSEHAERHLLALHGGEAGDALFDRVGKVW